MICSVVPMEQSPYIQQHPESSISSVMPLNKLGWHQRPPCLLLRNRYPWLHTKVTIAYWTRSSDCSFTAEPGENLLPYTGSALLHLCFPSQSLQAQPTCKRACSGSYTSGKLFTSLRSGEVFRRKPSQCLPLPKSSPFPHVPQVRSTPAHGAGSDAHTANTAARQARLAEKTGTQQKAPDSSASWLAELG